ncbi:FG-GAP repeat protein [Leptospira sp. 2 VSF19]|uniref:FG-GAP repeat protein n=2 Tax=Leptospira soteropolitanensis TaxID=2950025 RepID=A0AAW5VPF3_9LEPT|nr:FG-GAP repeat protein [Leptospira soteropolitanensis]MCW7494621.1 FG-GAP repeat protein [Leptospira soteropolitanensis]MCW7502211.1 FG-GAP repeat protein [Leptospira soteropolitanensis]MCW7524467.1 FG-GAP repeat protein [Leptospira soteropolitanensis]MCW7528333.1 FG-GAP repeat protein [Leptospira soteropolitanensis]MCW7532186.1 FG-GAP repeat protein [Leptospira soteropolitanensis]
MNNPCDPGSESYLSTLLLSSSAQGPVSFCGFLIQTPIKLWESQAYLKAANAEASDQFGGAVAISGDTIVVGAIGEASNQTTITNGEGASSDNTLGLSGAVYVYQRTGSTWSQQAYIKAPNAEAGDQFGVAVAIDGDTIVVGANLEDSNQTTITNGSSASGDNSASNAGAVYVYKRSGSTWVQEAYLKPSNAEASDQFGFPVAISGDTIVVGTYLEDSNQTTITNGPTASGDNSATSAGAIYVFQRSGSAWSQQAYIKPSNVEAQDAFGKGLAISGDTIVAGANLEDSNQTTITNGGTASSNNGATSAGAAYVYQRTGSTWVEQAYLKAPNAEAGDQFGEDVAISKDTIVVAAFAEASNQITITNGPTASSDNSAATAGAAYVFKRIGSTWNNEAYLKAPNAKTDEYFGTSLAIEGDTIVVSSIYEDSGQKTVTNGPTISIDNSSPRSGAIYVYGRTGSNWALNAYLKAPNADPDDRLGNSIGLSGDTIVVGANQEDSIQNTITNGPTASSDNSAVSSGAAYVFIRK